MTPTTYQPQGVNVYVLSVMLSLLEMVPLPPPHFKCGFLDVSKG